MAEEKKIATGYIGNALRSSAADHTTTFADEIFDTERQKYQNEVTADLETTDNEIKADLEAEKARAKAAEQANAQAIADETSRATAAEEANAQAINTLKDKTSEITKEVIETEDNSISIKDNNGNEVLHIDENGLDAKNVKSNGKDVLTEHQDISGLATKEEVANKQDTIQEVSKEETEDGIKEIVFYDDEKTKILHRVSENSADFHNLKSDGKNVMLNGISTYFLEEMNDTITKINTLAQDLCYVMPILADSHICNTDIDRKRSDESIRNVCYLNEHCFCNSVAHLGDLIQQDYFNTDEYTIEDASKFGYSLIQDYLLSLAKSNEHFYASPGNHDGTYNSKQFKSFSLPKWNSMIGRKLALDNSIVMPNGKSYFYVDCNNVKLRLIFLSIPDYKTLAYMGISQGQLEWFAQEALNIDNDWNIIILSHVPLCGEDIVGDTKLVPSLTGVCNAFNNKTSFSNSYINVDYSASNGKIIACIAGHWHEDIIKAPNEEWDIFGNHYKNDMPCVSIILASTYIGGHNNGGVTRTYGTYSQDLWNILVYKPNEKKIYFVRFGAGLDFYVDYNNNTYKI